MVDFVFYGALGSGFLAYALEWLLVPRPDGWKRRHPACHLLHWGLSLAGFSLVLQVLQRPCFASAVVGAFLFLVVMVNNAKYHSLRETFVCQDFEYFTDALKHPRLYIPFLGWGRAIAAALAAVLAIWLGFFLEKPLTAEISWWSFIAHCGALFIAGMVFLLLGNRYCPSVSYEPCNDLSKLGLLASLWCYWRDESRSVGGLPTRLPVLDAGGGQREDLVVVQSESFFDARRTYPELRQDLLVELDQLRQESIAWGKLAVPAWGANTVRSEFAFLSGLTVADLGVHRFNPYRKLAKAGIPTLASRLREVGYRTICIHPYPATFYERNRVYPLLGFDEFIDIASFEGAERQGPYISDNAVASMIEKQLFNRINPAQPLFIYAITMENHGPLHLERVAAGDIERLYRQPPPPGCDDLTIYGRHLVNAGHMFGRLRQMLNASSRSALLCLFGDHVPIMPAVYAQLALPDGDTDYVIWRAHCQETACARETPQSIENLAALLLNQVA